MGDVCPSAKLIADSELTCSACACRPRRACRAGCACCPSGASARGYRGEFCAANDAD
jgi:hypothetical protein